MVRMKSAKPTAASTFALKGEWDGTGDVLPLAEKPQPERLVTTVLPLDRAEMEWQRYKYCKQYLRGGSPKAAQRARWHSSPAPTLLAAFMEMAFDESRKANVAKVEQAKSLLGWDHLILM